MNGRIMIVEDDAVVLNNLEAALEDYGFEAIGVPESKAALDMVQSNHDIELAIIDYRLPDIDGLTLINKLHTLNPNIKYIIHTGSIEFKFHESMRDLGIQENQILYKPVKDEQILIDLINDLTK